jgi:hypothetical protein
VASVEQPKTKTVFSPPQLLLPLSAEKENAANLLPGTGHDTIGCFLVLTVSVPVVYMARDVMILMRATPITRVIGRCVS